MAEEARKLGFPVPTDEEINSFVLERWWPHPEFDVRLDDKQEPLPAISVKLAMCTVTLIICLNPMDSIMRVDNGIEAVSCTLAELAAIRQTPEAHLVCIAGRPAFGLLLGASIRHYRQMIDAIKALLAREAALQKGSAALKA